MNSSIFIALCSTVIALCALIFSVIEARRSAKISRLSVRPKLEIAFVRNRASFDDTASGIYIQNRGLGPAILNECRLVVGGASFNVANYSELEEFISKLGIERAEHGRVVMLPGVYLLPGVSYDIISFAASGSPQNETFAIVC